MIAAAQCGNSTTMQSRAASAVLVGRAWRVALPVALAVLVVACSSPSSSTDVALAGASGSGGPAGAAGTNASAGMSGGVGIAGAIGAAGAAGALAGAGAGAGAGATSVGGTTGSAGATATAGASGASGAAGAPGAVGGFSGIGMDIPAWRDLNVTVPPAQHTHTTPAGHTAGMDNRAAKMAGKLVVDLGVNAGGYQTYLGKRGFHVIGVGDVNDCAGIDDWTLGRDFDTNCRLNTLDGLPHGNQNKVTPEQSTMNQVLQALITFEATYPGEGWGYFLTQDGKAVRWSDVALTGLSHGAQSAACFGTVLRVYRVVPQSGPRDNTCGFGIAKGPYDAANPPYDVNCPIAHIATWLDTPPATPIDRFFGFVGGMDTQFGDIMYTMQYMHFTGDYVNVDTAKAPYGGSHRFYSLNTGHAGFPGSFPIDAINIAFGVLPENLMPTF